MSSAAVVIGALSVKGNEEETVLFLAPFSEGMGVDSKELHGWMDDL